MSSDGAQEAFAGRGFVPEPSKPGRQSFVSGAATVTTTVPNFARAALVPLTLAFSAYALAVLALREPRPMKSMSLWSLGAVFTDLSLPGIAETPPAGAGGPAQLLLAAVPFGADGQAALDKTLDSEILRRILADAEPIFPGLGAKFLGARVIRWRHAMPVAAPGYLTGLRPRLAEPWGRVSFAGQETEMPYSEGAIVSGFRAVAETRGRLKR